MDVGDYRYYLKVERSMSPNTVAGYCHDIENFEIWMRDNPGKTPEKASTDEIISYLQHRAETATQSAAGKGGYGERISKRTQARMLSALRSYFNWLILEGTIQANPCDGVDTPKLGRYLPEVLSVDEVDAIMDSVPLDNWRGLRDRAALELLYGCGLRVSEAASLKISQIFFEEGFVRIFGKGSKERLVPMGEMAATAVQNYLAARTEPSEGRYSDILLLNKNGTPLSRVSIFNMVKRQALAAGITKEISPHTFRHSFATHLIENGADLRVVQEMLGHESILTTEIYTHIDQSTWQNSVLKHHPRNGNNENE